VLCTTRESTEPDANGDLPPHAPLKPTANNNWAHITCALIHPETRFANAKTLKPVEGIGSIPPHRWTTPCSICDEPGGAVVHCHDCKLPVHVSCAAAAGFTVGFDIAPVKGSRRDVVSVVAFGGENGVMTAGVWCPEHEPTKTIIHPFTEVDPVTNEVQTPFALLIVGC
jgi:PHD-zinc-finger like domain